VNDGDHSERGLNQGKDRSTSNYGYPIWSEAGEFAHELPDLHIVESAERLDRVPAAQIGSTP